MFTSSTFPIFCCPLALTSLTSFLHCCIKTFNHVSSSIFCWHNFEDDAVTCMNTQNIVISDKVKLSTRSDNVRVSAHEVHTYVCGINHLILYYALICTTHLFHILAPTYFGSSLPSSGSFLDPSEVLGIGND
jgi:hypothetical protein